ncbi:class I SAM-dependent methyltransferase [Marichromatium bheemlicum]|uniref:Class I SAM-dependent methyltransferase n=1 Tax=Marichromatium bheemlicum TaxID=365339 RepID=A0ABX1I8P0_9GAMM|nr:class I SAM-dependent methyltransferase [Marichromatium bheemlicum]NKN32511.1 class I SAM-dependent methyltransferase [Marichromatium bheemlicum]
MRLNDPAAYGRGSEPEILAELLDPAGQEVLELGCGAAWMTRLLVERFGARRVVATEVDRAQLARNRALDLPAAIELREGGAQAIADPDERYAQVFMFKSLHHVPPALMACALREIHRVLVPGGALYVSEPVYWGPFAELTGLIHDERTARTAAFAALQGAVEAGYFRCEREVFYQAEGAYPDWECFAARFIDVSHRDASLPPGRRAAIRAAFERHLTPSGAHFLKPHRVDVLRKPG